MWTRPGFTDRMQVLATGSSSDYSYRGRPLGLGRKAGRGRIEADRCIGEREPRRYCNNSTIIVSRRREEGMRATRRPSTAVFGLLNRLGRLPPAYLVPTSRTLPYLRRPQVPSHLLPGAKYFTNLGQWRRPRYPPREMGIKNGGLVPLPITCHIWLYLEWPAATCYDYRRLGSSCVRTMTMSANHNFAH